MCAKQPLYQLNYTPSPGLSISRLFCEPSYKGERSKCLGKKEEEHGKCSSMFACDELVKVLVPLGKNEGSL